MDSTVKILLVMAIACMHPALAQEDRKHPELTEPSSDAEMAQYNVNVYVRAHHVSPEEARHRLDLQKGFDEFIPSLRDEFKERFSGIYLQHEPDYRVIVQLTGNLPVKDRVVKTSYGEIKVSFKTGKTQTEEEKRSALKKLQHNPESPAGRTGNCI